MTMEAKWGGRGRILVSGSDVRDNRPEWVREATAMDLRAILDFSAAGDALFQETVNRVIAKAHKRLVAAVAVLDFKPGAGDGYHNNRATPGPNGEWVDDTDLLEVDSDLTNVNAGTDTYTKVDFAYKFMLLQGAITRHTIRRAAGFVDVLAQELAGMVERATYTLEKAIFQGNFDGATPKEFTGLIKLLNGYNGDGEQVFTPPNAVGNATATSSVSGDLDTNTLDKCDDEVKGTNKVWFVSKAGSRLINSLLQAQRQYDPGDRITIAGGFRVSTYNDHPIVKTDHIGDEMAWNLSGGDPQISALTGATGSARTTAIILASTEYVFISELTPLTVEPINTGSTQRKKMEAYWDGVLVLDIPQGAGMIIGVLPE